jgi:Ca2+-binding EF-hand superfamily protein
VEVCDKLNKSQQGGWPPALAGAPDASENPYDDAVLAKARKITAMTNKLCDDLLVTCNKLEKSEQEDAEVSSLQEISIVTRQVCMNMMSLQEEGWAAGVLNTVPSGEPGDDDDKLPFMSEARNEAPAILYASQEPDAEPDAEKVAPREELRQAKVQAEADAEEEDEVSELVKRVANRSPDDSFSESETRRMRTAFNRFKVPDSADLHQDDLSGLLQYLGHVMTEEEGVKGLVKDVTDYDYLDFDEFLTFMQRYVAFERQEFHKTFEEFDEDKSGEISVTELRNMCNSLGFSIMKNMLQEALAVVDKDSNGQLGFEELVTFLAVYRHNEGFTRAEVAELHRAFDRCVCGSDSTGPSMHAESLGDALVLVFGLQIVEHAKMLERELLSGHGVGKSSLGGSVRGEGIVLYFPEFLIFARRVREAEIAKMKKQFPDWHNKVIAMKALRHHDEQANSQRASVFAQYDEDGSGTIGEDELRIVLKDKNYTPLRQNIHEVFCEVTGEKQGYGAGRELDFIEFFDFMGLFHARDGFLKDEVEKMRQVFDRFDDDHSGEINVLELSELLRHLGYLCTLDEIHEYVEEVDDDKSNQLDFREFLHLMRLLREQELQKARKAFKDNKAPPEEPDGKSQGLDREKVDAVLEELGHERPQGQSGSDMTKQFLDFDDFVHLLDSCREELVRKQRKKAGFTEQEIENFKEQFRTFDKDQSGMIDVWELQALLKEFGWAPKSKQEQTALIEKIDVARAAAREAGVTDVSTEHDHSVDITFWTFVQLARMLHSQHDRAEEAQMERLMQELKFTQQEVDEFRRVFRTQAHRQHEDSEDEDDHHHHQHHAHNTQHEGIPRDQVRRLIRQLGMTITAENRGRLDDKLHEYDEGGVIHFMNFLRLMKWMVDTDFAGINHTTPKK